MSPSYAVFTILQLHKLIEEHGAINDNAYRAREDSLNSMHFTGSFVCLVLWSKSS